MKVILPAARAWPAIPREFYAFFQQVASSANTANAIDLTDITNRLTTLERAESSDGTIIGAASVVTTGLLPGYVYITLDGDVDEPGNLYSYGTTTEGVKGWVALSDTIAVAGDLTKDVGADGVTTLGLADLADSGAGAALVKITRDSKGRIAGTSAATTSDLAEGTNLYYTDARAQGAVVTASISVGDTTHSPSGDAVFAGLALKIDATEKAAANGVATLGADGKLDTGQLPALAITETFVVADEASMLALVCQQGDVAVRTDLSTSFILTTDDPTILTNWQELLTPTGGVASFNGRTGSVTPASGDYTFAQIGSKPTTLAGYGITDAATATQGAKADAAEPGITAGTVAQYWRGDKTWQDFATDVRAAVLTGLSTATSVVIAATDTVLQALGKLQAQVSLKMDDAVPSARADANANQSIASGAFQKVLLGSEVFDVGGIYNPATSKFTPTKAGKYMAIGSVSLNPAITAGSRVIAAVAKNGTVIENVTSPATSSPTNNVQHCLVFDMNGTTDYLELYARQDSGSTINVLGNAGTNMVVFRVGA